MSLKTCFLCMAIFWVLGLLFPGRAQAISVSVSDVSAKPGETGVAVAIEVDDASGIAGAVLTLTYDPSALKVKTVQATELLAANEDEGYLAPTVAPPKVDPPGQVRITFAGATGIPAGRKGALIRLILDVESNAEPGDYPLKLVKAEFINEDIEDIPLDSITSGVFTIEGPGVPIISLLVSSLTFDDTDVGSSSQADFTIFNNGDADLSITGITVTGTDALHFMISSETATIAPGESRKVTVTFSPSSEGAKSTSLTILHNAEGSNLIVALDGKGVSDITDAPIECPSDLVPKPGNGTAELGIGNLRTKCLGGVKAEQQIEIPIVLNQEVREADALWVELTIDPDKLSLVSIKQDGVFAEVVPSGGPMVGGNTVALLGAIFGETVNAKGPVVTFTLMTLSGFSGDTEIVLTNLSLGDSSGKEHAFKPEASVVLSSKILENRELEPKPGDGTGELGVGDLKIKKRGGVMVGQEIDIPIAFNLEVENSTGFGVILTFDPEKLSVVSDKAKKGRVFGGAITLPPQVEEDTVEFGGSLLGGTTTATGLVALLTFEILSGFSGETEIVLSSLSIKTLGESQDFTPGASVVLSSETHGGCGPDFNCDDKVDFDDFFLFAAAFGTNQGEVGFDAKFDLSNSGKVDFEDFFIFAAAFGK